MKSGPPLKLLRDEEGRALALTRSRLALGVWSHLAWEERVFTARFTGWVFFGGRVVSVPFEDIEDLELACAEETGEPLQLNLWLRYRAAKDQERVCELSFCVEALDLRVEALDLFHRITKILQLEHFEAHSEGQWSASKKSGQDPFRGSALQRVPEHLGQARYAARSYQPEAPRAPEPARATPTSQLRQRRSTTTPQRYIQPARISPPRLSEERHPNPSAKRDERRTWLQRELQAPSQRRPSGLHGPRGKSRR